MDTIPQRKRSEIMRAVKGKDSKMELALCRELSKQGLRYRKNVARLPGKPDIVFSKKKIVKRHCRLPTSNKRYWTKKIERNKQRDKEVNKKYKLMVWKAARFWEHDLNKNLNKIAARIQVAVEKISGRP